MRSVTWVSPPDLRDEMWRRRRERRTKTLAGALRGYLYRRSWRTGQPLGGAWTAGPVEQNRPHARVAKGRAGSFRGILVAVRGAWPSDWTSTGGSLGNVPARSRCVAAIRFTRAGWVAAGGFWADRHPWAHTRCRPLGLPFDPGIGLRSGNFLYLIYHDFAKIYGPPQILQKYTSAAVAHGVRNITPWPAAVGAARSGPIPFREPRRYVPDAEGHDVTGLTPGVSVALS
jgi:hypothetical protein